MSLRLSHRALLVLSLPVVHLVSHLTNRRASLQRIHLVSRRASLRVSLLLLPLVSLRLSHRVLLVPSLRVAPVTCQLLNPLANHLFNLRAHPQGSHPSSLQSSRRVSQVVSLQMSLLACRRHNLLISQVASLQGILLYSRQSSLPISRVEFLLVSRLVYPRVCLLASLRVSLL